MLTTSSYERADPLQIQDTSFLVSTLRVSFLLAGALVLYVVYKRATGISIRLVLGPEAESFFLGNLPEIFQSQAGAPDFKYQQMYGDIVRFKGPFGNCDVTCPPFKPITDSDVMTQEDRLLISDPKTLSYIINGGYAFPKWPERREISRILMGRGLLWADGEIHRRQRRVMLPGFGAPESKGLVPIFQRVASQLTEQWNDILVSSPDQSAVLNVSKWLSRATMDCLGEAAFDYQFGALANTNNGFMKSYMGLMNDTLGSPPKPAIFMQAVLPVWVLQLISKFSPAKNVVHARHTEALANAITQQMVDSKMEAFRQGTGEKDILSLLVQANAASDQVNRLTEEEIFAEMRTLLLAGHETSAVSLCWVMLELAKNPEMQNKLREEIRTTERSIHARGVPHFTANDLDNMPYLAAVIKESMRFHPALHQNYRQTASNDVFPLSRPIRLTNGKLVNELPVPKGTKLILSIAAYNRNKEVFGDDADVFNPDRWLRDSSNKKTAGLGVYSNLLTFAGGIRACIGWRFAVYELFALTVEIINNFQLDVTPDIGRLRREACLVMIPTLEGEQHKGENLPLRVQHAPRD